MSAGTVRSRSDGFRRYAALLAAQHQALDDGDFERFLALGAERDEIARAIDRAPTNPPDAELRDLVHHCVLEDERLRQRMIALRDEARDAIRAMDRRLPDLHGYLNTARPTTSTFDVRR